MWLPPGYSCSIYLSSTGKRLGCCDCTLSAKGISDEGKTTHPIPPFVTWTETEIVVAKGREAVGLVRWFSRKVLAKKF